MDIIKRIVTHDRRWNINLDYEKNFTKFKNRLIDSFNRLIGDFLVENSDIDKDFFEIFKLYEAKEPVVQKSSTYYVSPELEIDKLSIFPRTRTTQKGFGDTNFYKCIKDCQTPQEIATTLQILFWTLEEKDKEMQALISELVKEIKNLSSLTPSVSFQIHKKRKQFIVYPHGDKFLDKKIVDCVLSGLEDYPEVAKHFEEALKIYQTGQESQYRNLLDNLRFALEQLFKKVFKNSKSLEKQKNTEEVLKWLRSKGLHSQVVNLYQKLLSDYILYQNDAVKHEENFSVVEVEFMIYLTGSFIRFILQLEKQKDSSFLSD